MNKLLGCLAGLCVCCYASGGGSAETQPSAAPTKMDHSYIKLFTLIMAGPLKDTSDKHLEYIAKNYRWINSHGGEWLKGAQLDRIDYQSDAWEYTFGKSAGVDAEGRTVGDRLRALNPEIILTNYRNGAYTSQNAMNEANEVESGLPLSIAVFDTSQTLTKAVSRDATVVELTPSPEVPKDRPKTFPWKASTTEAEHSKDKAAYVAFMRLDDELLRIDKVEALVNGNIQLSVRRGLWGTSAAEHAIETKVFQPIYCGRLNSETGQEYYLSGLPDGNSPQRALRYVMNNNHEEFYEFLAKKSEGCIKDGYDGPWYDCTVSEWINHSNAFGDKVWPYDIDKKQPLTHDDFRAYHQKKIDYMFAKFPESKFYVNWVFPQFYFDNGHDKYLFSGEGGHKPISGGAIEIYAVPGRMDWHQLMKMQIDMRDNNYNHVSWAKMGGGKGDDANPPEYLLYAYCTHLMVHEDDKPMAFGAKWRPDNAPESPFIPPDFVFWNLGKPQQKFSDIGEAELKDSPGIYARRFAKGMVLVNPDTKQTATVKLDGKYYDITSEQWVESIEVKSVGGALLLKGE